MRGGGPWLGQATQPLAVHTVKNAIMCTGAQGGAWVQGARGASVRRATVCCGGGLRTPTRPHGSTPGSPWPWLEDEASACWHGPHDTIVLLFHTKWSPWVGSGERGGGGGVPGWCGDTVQNVKKRWPTPTPTHTASDDPGLASLPPLPCGMWHPTVCINAIADVVGEGAHPSGAAWGARGGGGSTWFGCWAGVGPHWGAGGGGPPIRGAPHYRLPPM